MNKETWVEKREMLARQRAAHAAAIAAAGGVLEARRSGSLPGMLDTTVSEVLVLGLLLQGVNTFLAVFGHGSIEIGEVLRIYQEAGLLRVLAVRSEIEASHAATALRWVTGQKAAVVTSIGPGALQALAASLTPGSNGLGVWYLLGDETTEDEGPNFQQIPRNEQASFLKLFSQIGRTYSLHTPLALSAALRRGLNTVDHPHRAGPFFFLLPMNIQSVALPGFNLDELPYGAPPPLGAAADQGVYRQAAEAILASEKVVVRLGGGARNAGPEILEFLELADGVAITAPLVSGVIPFHHPRNMTVAGSKGSISGNYAMEQADLLVAIGTRFVCQSDCSRTGYLNTGHVVNINVDPETAIHYGKTTALVGDAAATLWRLNQELRQSKAKVATPPSLWMAACTHQRMLWEQYKADRYNCPTLYDPAWGCKVLTQPAAIKTATDWARANQVTCFFDAGDVQAHGFQIVEDERLGQTFTDGGASYMGFAASALLAVAVASQPFYALALCGDGSFTMNPQILIDGVEHGVRGCVLVFDNRRMGAITGLQLAQYGHEFATNDSVEVDYVAWAGAVKGVLALHGGYNGDSLLAALVKAYAYAGLSLIHLPVYFGPDELGSFAAFGRWNVGNWSEATQALRHKLGL